MKFQIKVFNQTALQKAVEKNKIEITKVLLSYKRINANLRNVHMNVFWIKF